MLRFKFTCGGSKGRISPRGFPIPFVTHLAVIKNLNPLTTLLLEEFQKDIAVSLIS